MSGICAAWERGNPQSASRTVALMNAGLTLASSERFDQESHDGLSIGVTARFAGQQIHRSSRLIVACDAALVNGKELASTLGGVTEFLQPNGSAALIAALYQRFGNGFV